MTQLSTEQIRYLRAFLSELDSQIPHSSDESNENFLDDLVNKSSATYRFYFDEGKRMQWFDGTIWVDGNKAFVSIVYDSPMLRRPDLNRHVERIADATGVHSIFTLENKLIQTDASGLGFVNIPIFRETGNLTVEEFAREYLFKVSQAAKQASEIEKSVAPALYK